MSNPTLSDSKPQDFHTAAKLLLPPCPGTECTEMHLLPRPCGKTHQCPSLTDEETKPSLAPCSRARARIQTQVCRTLHYVLVAVVCLFFSLFPSLFPIKADNYEASICVYHFSYSRTQECKPSH